jgi:diguanylate cyclase (GGDEF)-like protein
MSRIRTDGAAGRRSSLRREWSRAFVIMLALVLVSAVATIVGVRGLVGQVRGTARQLHRESSTVSVLSADLVDHEEIAHKLLSNEPVDRVAFVEQQAEISRLFVQAIAVFPATNGMKATVVAAQKSWQAGLTAYGLWGAQVQTLAGDHSAENPTFGASSDDTDAMLAGLEGPSLDAMNRGLSHAGDLEAALIGSLSFLFALAFAATVYFRRRMVKDLLRPVTNMHEGVLKLRGGEYEHRIAVARHDELGDLTDAFNGMAGALHISHLALTQRATHDSLTGLLNRASLTERLAASFGPSADRRAVLESVLFIDVDDFKEVNDTLGHEGGDALLVQLANRLQACVRPQDMVARLGGDEFAIVVAEDAHDDGAVASRIAERILDDLRSPFTVNGLALVVSVSIGAAHRRPDTVDAAEMLRSADFAMYMAKGSGKNRYQLFDSQVRDGLVERTTLKTELAAAVDADELRLDYQPVVDLRSGAIVGVEALVRWEHPTRGRLTPADFIALAEETGDIAAIGCWALRTAASQLQVWRERIVGYSDLWVAVNVSPFQLANPDSVAAIEGVLADPALDPRHIVLEITETALTSDIAGGVAALNALKALGVRIAIDDFGSGFSSLSTLTDLPVDILKIDRSFVSGSASSTPSVPMLESILDLARKFSLDVVAEGIEDREQCQLLQDLGCKLGQGFLLARPMPALAVATMLSFGPLAHVTGSLQRLPG